MLKQLAALSIGAALVLAPVAAFAQSEPAPAATETPAPDKVVHHHKAKHVVKKPVAAKPMAKHHAKHHAVKTPAPAPTPTETPKS